MALCRAITSRAMRSSSAVVMPGLTASRMAARARATMRPASRMMSSSSGFLMWITGSTRLDSCRDRAHQIGGHFVDGLVSVDLSNQALCPVVIQQRRGFLEVQVDATGCGFGGIIVALAEGRIVNIATPRNLRRVGGLVVDV